MSERLRVKPAWHGFSLWWQIRDERGQLVDEYPKWADAVQAASTLESIRRGVDAGRTHTLKENE